MKRVLFVCGSLEPGHDGVGDYTRELAGELIKLELDVKIIAIRDKNIKNVVAEKQQAREKNVDVIRLGKSLSLSKKKKEYLLLLADYKPDWISLQYVPYAFSSKGIPLGLPRFLETGSSVLKWHFMIHESYIGGDLSFKDRLIKKGQIAVLKSLEKKLKPKIVNTSTPQYKSYLSAIGMKSKILGLFGNIPVTDTVQCNRDDQTFRAVYFGASPNFGNIRAFVLPLKQYLTETNRKIEIVLCGNSGEKGKQFAALLRNSVDNDRFAVQEKGRMSTDDLSKLFLNMDFGIARIPPHLIGKSGSAIALLEHGLPLWVPLAASQSELVSAIDFRVNQCFFDLRDVINNDQKFELISRLNKIATTFKNELLCKLNTLQDT